MVVYGWSSGPDRCKIGGWEVSMVSVSQVARESAYFLQRDTIFESFGGVRVKVPSIHRGCVVGGLRLS